MNESNQIKPFVKRHKRKPKYFSEVELKVGDVVIDVIGDSGSFQIEEIRESDGWVWGSGMKYPYFEGLVGKRKNFHNFKFLELL